MIQPSYLYHMSSEKNRLPTCIYVGLLVFFRRSAGFNMVLHLIDERIHENIRCTVATATIHLSLFVFWLIIVSTRAFFYKSLCQSRTQFIWWCCQAYRALTLIRFLKKCGEFKDSYLNMYIINVLTNMS